MPKIAFVCTGNICRSPLAEYLLRALAPQAWNLVVCSFGMMTVDGHEASGHSIIVGLEEGLDLSPHRSRALRPSELRECDLILTMSKSQKTNIVMIMPDLGDRVFCLTEYGAESSRTKDIDDPIGGDLSVYRKCLKKIRVEIERILPVLGNFLGVQ